MMKARGERQSRRNFESELAVLEWLREQVINDNKLEFCATEEERVSLLAMLNRQKQRRKKAIKDEANGYRDHNEA